MLKKTMKIDLVRAVCSFRFFISVFIMFLVWYLNSKRFGIKEDILYLFINVWGRSTTPLLAIVVSSFGYVASYSEDVENHFLKYSLLRIGIKRYIISKIIICFFTSFLIITLGTALFLFSQSYSLPLVADHSITVANFAPVSCFGNLISSHAFLFILLQLFLFGLLCGGMSVLALAFSTFVKNSYGVFVIPFLLHYTFFYLFSQIANKHPIFDIENVYSCFVTDTNNAALFLLYALFVTLLFVSVSFGIMYKKIKGDFS